MLYLLGGASRAGKSKLARRLLIERHIAYLSTDMVVMGFANGLPAFGIDPDAFPTVYGEKLWPLLRGMAVNVLESERTYLFEGDALLPRYVAELLTSYGDQIKAAFLGYTDPASEVKLQAIRAFEGENDWLQNSTDAAVLNLISEMIDFSHYVRQECAIYHIPYFDTSEDFLGAHEAAFRYFVGA
jgi:hypothetical protein